MHPVQGTSHHVGIPALESIIADALCGHKEGVSKTGDPGCLRIVSKTGRLHPMETQKLNSRLAQLSGGRL